MSLVLAWLAVAHADETELHFAWPDDLELAVTGDRTLSTFHPDSVQTWHSRSTWNWKYDAAARTLSVADYVRNVLVRPTSAPGHYETETFVGVITDSASSFQLTTDGQVSAVLDAIRIRADVEAGLASSDKPIPPQAADQVRALATDAALLGLASDFWAKLVYTWSDSAVSTEAAQDIVQVPVAVLGVTVPFARTSHLDATGPCPDDPALTCVTVRLETRPDAEAMKAELSNMAGKLANQPGASFTSLDVSDTYVLVTDPATLVPRRLEAVRRTVIATSDGNPACGLDRRVYTFAVVGAA